MQDEQQVWIDATLASLDGLQRASAPAGLHARVMARIAAGKPKRIILRAPMVWLAAAGFLLLVGLNGYALLHHHGNGDGSLSRTHAQPGGPLPGNPLVEEYFAPEPIL